MIGRIPESLRTYIEQQILPRYDGFDAAHRRDHAQTVIRQSPETAAARVRRSFEIAATCVRRMMPQPPSAAPAKVLITVESPMFK